MNIALSKFALWEELIFKNVLSTIKTCFYLEAVILGLLLQKKCFSACNFMVDTKNEF